MTSKPEIQVIATDVLSKALASIDFSDADVAVEQDFDGEDVIKITAKVSHALPDSAALFEAASDIRQKLIARGDDRFVFVRQEYPGLVRAEVDDDAEGSRIP